MKRRLLLFGTVLLLCSLTFLCDAQERGYWRAASTSARGITGDIAFSGEKITINFSSFTLAEIRALTGAELTALFDAEPGSAATGTLYRVSIPPSKLFLHRNSLCGAQETDWVVTYVSGHSLRTALFSEPGIPDLSAEGIANGTRLCGTYSYVR